MSHLSSIMLSIITILVLIAVVAVHRISGVEENNNNIIDQVVAVAVAVIAIMDG